METKSPSVFEPSHEQIVMAFVATCIEATARMTGTTYMEVLRRMQNVGLIENFIVPHYETLHTQSRDNLGMLIASCQQEWEENQ